MKNGKGTSLLILIIALLVLIFAIGCTESPETQLEGTIKVVFTGDGDFANKTYYFSVYDSDETDEVTGVPTGNNLAQASITLDDNGDGEGFACTAGGTGPSYLFSEGTYYIGGIVDMNENYSTSNPVDTGDRYGDFNSVTITTTENTVNLGASDYTLAVP